MALFILGQKFPHLQAYRWLIITPVILAALLFSMVKIVPLGHVGILVLFGKIHGSVTEGLHLVNPLVSMELMNVRTQEIFEPAEAPSKEGLNIVLADFQCRRGRQFPEKRLTSRRGRIKS
jgi:regulator of protease activity HflC (stomatin/prohibitin superfamily)